MSALGAVTSLNAAFGYSRRFANWFIGAWGPFGSATLVTTRRVYSMVTSGYP